jgi:phosphatidate cytidylyltransferase
MLRQRVITAVVLLVLLGAVLGSGSAIAFVLTLAIFFGAACWEALKLSGMRFALPLALMSAAVLLPIISRATGEWIPLASVCMVLWLLRFFPALRFGLPENAGLRGALFNSLYLIALLGCFISIAGLWQRSAVFLLSAMAMVWVADIGAYFAGRAFGKRKLAPSISPGKTWEGVAGGLVAVLVLAALAAQLPETFQAQLLVRYGWFKWVLFLGLFVAASVVGDLFESMLKRRAEVKDSSGLLPGHGGVLDRIDALVPTMPLAYLLSAQIPLAAS